MYNTYFQDGLCSTPKDVLYLSLPTVATNTTKDLMPCAKVYLVTLHEGVFVVSNMPSHRTENSGVVMGSFSYMRTIRAGSHSVTMPKASRRAAHETLLGELIR